VFQHRPVDLLQQVCPDLDDEVGPDPEDMTVVGRVMDLAESQAVAYRRGLAFSTAAAASLTTSLALGPGALVLPVLVAAPPPKALVL
jgi:hypothetical protein